MPPGTGKTIFPWTAFTLTSIIWNGTRTSPSTGEAFPDFEQLVEDMKQQGIHLVPIIDGGVKIEDGYEVYEEGVKTDFFCKDEGGDDFVVGSMARQMPFS